MGAQRLGQLNRRMRRAVRLGNRAQLTALVMAACLRFSNRFTWNNHFKAKRIYMNALRKQFRVGSTQPYATFQWLDKKVAHKRKYNLPWQRVQVEQAERAERQARVDESHNPINK